MMPADVQTKPLLYGRQQAAARLGVSVRTMDELILSRQIGSVKIGKRRLVSEDAIQLFIKKSEKAAR